MTGLAFNMVIVLAQTAPSGGGAGSSHTMWLLWGIVLIALGIAMFLVEMLVPTGGVIGLAATAAVVVGVVLLFRVDTTFGLIGAIVALGALPFLIAAAIKLWPDTPIGRLLTLEHAGRSMSSSSESGEAEAVAVELGETGKALTPLRPVGTVLFDHGREECLAVGGVIVRGTTVRVVNVDGRQIKVKAVGG